jgi:hypothetical protein
MRTYTTLTGVLFALLALSHVARVIAEGPHLATDPFFVVITIVAAAFSVWAWRLLRLSSR